MNVYDFDKTIFYPDSSYCFVRYCLRHYPRAVLTALSESTKNGLLWAAKKIDTKELKESVFSFLPRIDNIEQVVTEFWNEYRSHIAAWYRDQQRSEDLIISASPEFLLRPVAEELGVALIATRMDPHTGRIIGNNCHDSEKICRFLKEYPGQQPETFYSDSLSDSPMAWFSREAWLVKDGKELVPWPNK